MRAPRSRPCRRRPGPSGGALAVTEAQDPQLGDGLEQLVDVFAAVRVGPGRRRNVGEARLEPGVARGLAPQRRAHGRPVRHLLDLPQRHVDLVEERGPADRVEHAARREQRVGLRASQGHGATALARLDAPKVRPAGADFDRLELGDERELAQVAAHRARGDAQHRGELLERQAPGVRLELLAQDIEPPVLRELARRAARRGAPWGAGWGGAWASEGSAGARSDRPVAHLLLVLVLVLVVAPAARGLHAVEALRVRGARAVAWRSTPSSCSRPAQRWRPCRARSRARRSPRRSSRPTCSPSSRRRGGRAGGACRRRSGLPWPPTSRARAGRGRRCGRGRGCGRERGRGRERGGGRGRGRADAGAGRRCGRGGDADAGADAGAVGGRARRLWSTPRVGGQGGHQKEGFLHWEGHDSNPAESAVAGFERLETRPRRPLPGRFADHEDSPDDAKASRCGRCNG